MSKAGLKQMDVFEEATQEATETVVERQGHYWDMETSIQSQGTADS
jgi:hypothetical protein